VPSSSLHQTCAIAATLFIGALFFVDPAAAAPAHCEADTGPGLALISATFDDAGKDMAAVARQWAAYAVQNKASAASAKCTSGSAEDAIDAAYGGAEFKQTGWTPAK
jgi:hypothetical protein